jgi:hypothetical protein
MALQIFFSVLAARRVKQLDLICVSVIFFLKSSSLVRYGLPWRETMNNSKKSDPKRPPIESPDDELVIDLVDEVPEGTADGDLSDLEKNLLSLERSFDRSLKKTDAELRTFPELPDLNDLNGFDFEEDEADLPASDTLPTAAALAPLPDGLEPELDWLLDEDAPALVEDPARRGGAGDNEVTEISEFDEQFLEAEEVMDGLPAAEDESDGGSDGETLELLELDDEETDNELVWFDDGAAPPEPAEVTPAAQAGGGPLEPADPRLSAEIPAAETSAADLFDAFLQSGKPAAGEALETAELPAAAAAPLAAIAGATALSQARTAAVSQPPVVNALTEDQIEAAVERVITRLHAGTIETIIRQSIEKAVLKEIERLKNRLLENDPGDKIR